MFFNMMQVTRAFLHHIRPMFVWRGRFSGRKFQKTVYPDVPRARNREKASGAKTNDVVPAPLFFNGCDWGRSRLGQKNGVHKFIIFEMRRVNSCRRWLLLISGFGTIPAITVLLWEWLFFEEPDEDEGDDEEENEEEG